MTNRVVHFQLGAVDADRLARFCGDVFGWTIRDARPRSEEGGVGGAYRLISSDEAGLSGGVTAVGSRGVVLTVEVDDIGETLKRAERRGGRRLADVEAAQLLLEGAGARTARSPCTRSWIPRQTRCRS